MNQNSPLVHILDDDISVSRSLVRLLASAGFECRAYSSAKEFLETGLKGISGCLVVDLFMPEMSGLEVQEALMRGPSRMPVIFLSGRGDVPSSVSAMKKGAVDFLTKPVNAEELVRVVKLALRKGEQERAKAQERAGMKERLERLTPREMEVLGYVIKGFLNKQIAGELGTVEKTVKVHRARLMRKLEANSLAELVVMMERYS